MSFLWIIFSYLLGSFPSGYLISRFSGKNILEIGWRKTSGSNVFKNVGKWQGILTGVLDIAKGYLAVFGSQRLDFSTEIQIFSGVAAITGNNWSLFLKFAGGRGIGTFAGAFLAFSPQILGLSLIPLILLVLIWNASIGTILFLALAIYLSLYFNQFSIVGLFIVFSLLPILIKRLSPIEEILKSTNKMALIRNRLIFDNDKACLDLRIKRILKSKNPSPSPAKIRYGASKLSSILKFLTVPILLPPKIGWKVAKFGIKVAKKPIETLLFPTPEKVVTEIGIKDLKNIMIASAKKIVFHQEEINKINVWPVADKDTGYNLAATLLGIEGTISQREYDSMLELTRDIKEAAMINARGNAGMIYTGYLISFLDQIRKLDSINGLELSSAMRKGFKGAYHSIINPVEGTILDVIKVSGEKSYELAKIKKEKNIIKILEEAHKVSEIALKETKEKLEALKKADVVDAGALGFVKILEAWIENLKGITPVPKIEPISPISEPETKEKLKYRYEVVLSFKKVKEISVKDLKRELSSLGDSLEIIELEDKIKLHIHTNQPDLVKEKFKNFPDFEGRVEDMERSGLVGDESKDSSSPSPRAPRRALGLVVDEIADLPKEFLEKYNIFEISFTTRFPDGEIITSEIYPKMREAIIMGKPLPTTSAPSFKEFVSIYRKALEQFEKILVFTVSSKLSGTYSSARIARSVFKKPEKLNIFVFDCFTAEVAEGLVVIKTQELISQGKKVEEILNVLKEFCPKVRLLACIEDFRYVVYGGRVKLPKILISIVSLIQKIGIRPIIGLQKGRIKFLGIKFGKNVAKILAEEIDYQRKGGEIRVAIAHADNLKLAEELKRALELMPKVKVLFISSASPVVGTHAGPGALLVAFHPVDN